MSCINLLAVHSSRGDAGGARLEENPTLQGLTSSSPKSVLILAHGTSPAHLQDLSDLFSADAMRWTGCPREQRLVVSKKEQRGQQRHDVRVHVDAVVCRDLPVKPVGFQESEIKMSLGRRH